MCSVSGCTYIKCACIYVHNYVHVYLSGIIAYCNSCSLHKYCSALDECFTCYPHVLQRIGEESSHLFPFMLHDAKGRLAQVYCKVKQLMTAVTQVEKTAQMDKSMVDGLAEITKSVGLDLIEMAPLVCKGQFHCAYKAVALLFPSMTFSDQRPWEESQERMCTPNVSCEW